MLCSSTASTGNKTYCIHTVQERKWEKVQERCFQRRDSLHHNANMCYSFTAPGSAGTDVTHRSRTVKSKMEECDGSRFYCSFLWMPTLCMMGILQPLLKGKKVLKKKCVGRAQELTFCIEEAVRRRKVQIGTRGVMSCLQWIVADVCSLAGALAGCSWNPAELQIKA